MVSHVIWSVVSGMSGGAVIDWAGGIGYARCMDSRRLGRWCQACSVGSRRLGQRCHACPVHGQSPTGPVVLGMSGGAVADWVGGVRHVRWAVTDWAGGVEHLRRAVSDCSH